MAGKAVGGVRQLVFGDDRSPGADVGWLWLNSQSWPGWRLVVVAADPPPVGTTVAPELARPHPQPDAPTRAVFDEPGFDDVDFLVANADPRVALCSFDDASLVVVGTSSGGLGARHIGSTAEWLLHDPDVPTLIARRGRPVGRAVVCADGSPHAAAAAASFAAMPWIGSVEVEVVAIDDRRTDCDAAVAAIEKILASESAGVTSTIRTGRPHDEILGHIGDVDADLVALGSHGLTTLRRVLLGSTASAVARLAPCSVLVAQDAEDPSTA